MRLSLWSKGISHILISSWNAFIKVTFILALSSVQWPPWHIVSIQINGQNEVCEPGPLFQADPGCGEQFSQCEDCCDSPVNGEILSGLLLDAGAWYLSPFQANVQLRPDMDSDPGWTSYQW